MSTPVSTHIPAWVPVDFDDAAVQQGSAPGSYILTVSGYTPSGGDVCLGARLVSDRKYFAQPEYWAISVEFDTEGAIFQSLFPYKNLDTAQRHAGDEGDRSDREK